MLKPVRTVAPAETPVTLAEAKAACRVDFDDDDAVITGLIAAAVDHLDGHAGVLGGRALVTQTWQQDFPHPCDPLRLAIWPVASVTSVTYYDADNASQTLASSVYQLFADARGNYLGLKPDQDWPSVYDRRDALRVTYVAGAAVNAVPPAAKTAILMLVAHWYANREAVADGAKASVPHGFDMLVKPLRRRRV